MNQFVAIVIDSCFPKTKTEMASMVFLELQKSLDTATPIRSLAQLSIREIIKGNIRMESTGVIYFKLLFREPLDIVHTSQLVKDDNYLEARFNQGLYCRQSRLPSFLKNDPVLMAKVFQQNLHCDNIKSVRIYTQKRQFRVEIDDQCVLEVSHGNKQDYYSVWPVVFSKIAFAKKIVSIDIQLEVNPMWDMCYLKMWMNAFLSDIGIVGVGDKRWRKAVSIPNPVFYHLSVSGIKNNLHYSQALKLDPELTAKNPAFRRVFADS